MRGCNSGLSNQTKISHMNQLRDYREQVLRPTPILAMLFFELTALCNERCLHCGSSCIGKAPEGELTTAEFKGILDQVKRDFDITDLQLCITGGEPLLRKDFFEIMEYARDLGFLWGMTSNGSLITKEMAIRLRDSGMKTISISVDGLRENHEWFRRTPGSYDRSIQGVKNLLEAGAPIQHVQITTVVNRRNIDELDAMYEEFSKLGIRSWRVINMEPIGRAKEIPELMLTPEEYQRIFDFIWKMRFAGPMEVCYGCSHYLGVELEREVRPWYFLCNAGIYTASITSTGDITACLDIERRPELTQGNVRKDDFTEVWKNRFEIYRTDWRKTGPCEQCEYYEHCAGDSFHTWNFDEMKPELCMKGILF